jgi:hypothetical protein
MSYSKWFVPVVVFASWQSAGSCFSDIDGTHGRWAQYVSHEGHVVNEAPTRSGKELTLLVATITCLLSHRSFMGCSVRRSP